MYRRSIDYNIQAAIQIVQFNSFRKKNEQTIQFIIEDETNKIFKIGKGNNTLIMIMIIADLLNQSRGKIRKSNKKVFQNFNIENVPKSYYLYQHENTLEQIWTILIHKIKNIINIQQLLTNYIIVQFMLLCYGRKIIKQYIQPIKQNQSILDLQGNQLQILLDYNSEIRGNLLHYLALALKLNVNIRYKDMYSIGDQYYNQYYGDSCSLNKIQIQNQGQYYRVSLQLNQQISRMISIQSTSTIQPIRKKQHQQSLDTTMQGQSTKQNQSHSANKDNMITNNLSNSSIVSHPSTNSLGLTSSLSGIKCMKCKSRNCQCDRVKKQTPKIIIEKNVNTSANNTSSSNNVKSPLFQGVVSTSATRKNHREDTHGRVCGICGKLLCICRK